MCDPFQKLVSFEVDPFKPVHLNHVHLNYVIQIMLAKHVR